MLSHFVYIGCQNESIMKQNVSTICVALRFGQTDVRLAYSVNSPATPAVCAVV